MVWQKEWLGIIFKIQLPLIHEEIYFYARKFEMLI